MELRRVEPGPLDGAEGVDLAQVLGWTPTGRVRVDVAVLEAGASLPRHAAGCDQTVYVLRGAGHVAGEDGTFVSVCARTVVVWAKGEQHETWADSRMELLIVQAAPVAAPVPV